MTAAKRLIYAGLVRARPELPGGRAGVLVDERYGQPVIDAAHADRVVLALPVERSGRDWFELEWGQQWLEHVTSDRPDFAKVLIRDNPAFPRGDRERQLHAPREVSDALHRIGVPLLYELLVPATDGQLAHVGGSASAYDRDLRPGLVIRVIADNQAVGSGRSKAWRRRTPRGPSWPDPAGGRDHVGAIVLGRDAPTARLDHWLAVAAPVDGFMGVCHRPQHLGRTDRRPHRRQGRRGGDRRPDRRALPGLCPPVLRGRGTRLSGRTRDGNLSATASGQPASGRTAVKRPGLWRAEDGRCRATGATWHRQRSR